MQLITPRCEQQPLLPAAGPSRMGGGASPSCAHMPPASADAYRRLHISTCCALVLLPVRIAICSLRSVPAPSTSSVEQQSTRLTGPTPQVICRQLGFGGGSVISLAVNARTLPSILTGVLRCSGKEKALSECIWEPRSDYNCTVGDSENPEPPYLVEVVCDGEVRCSTA